MADVTGPISSLPGSFHNLPDNAMCDIHLDVAAVARVQSETGSFGSKMNMCQACLDEHRKYYNNSIEARTGRCDYCKCEATDLSYIRDYEEGMYGPVYHVCGTCRKRVRDAEAMDYDDYNDLWDDQDYYDDAHDFYEEDCAEMEAERADREAADLAHREALIDRKLYRNEWRDKK